jgi:hypothetical protein
MYIKFSKAFTLINLCIFLIRSAEKNSLKYMYSIYLQYRFTIVVHTSAKMKSETGTLYASWPTSILK